MTSAELNSLKRHLPFQPFRVLTATNESYDVMHPYFILVGKQEVNIGLAHPTEAWPTVSDVVWLRVEDVVRTEAIGEPLLDWVDDEDLPRVPKDRQLTARQLHDLKWQRPFRPFRVKTTMNEEYEVRHPGLVLVGKDEMHIGIPHPTEPPPRVSDLVWLGAEIICEVEYLN